MERNNLYTFSNRVPYNRLNTVIQSIESDRKSQSNNYIRKKKQITIADICVTKNGKKVCKIK